MASDYRTPQLHQDRNEEPPTGWMHLPSPLQHRLCQSQTAPRKRDQSMDENISQKHNKNGTRLPKTRP